MVLGGPCRVVLSVKMFIHSITVLRLYGSTVHYYEYGLEFDPDATTQKRNTARDHAIVMCPARKSLTCTRQGQAGRESMRNVYVVL